MHRFRARQSVSISATTALIGLLVSHAADAVCSCQCLAGEPRTLCTQFDEAAALDEQCGSAPINLDCPPVSALSATPPPTPLESPVEGAHGCRTSVLWSPATNSYSVAVRVCETTPAANPAGDR